MKKSLPILSAPVRDLLLAHPLPGNVRQLQHAMERAVALSRGEMILPVDLPLDLLEKAGPLAAAFPLAQRNLKEALGYFEREFILQALSVYEGKKIPTAKALGISRKTLWEKIQRYQLGDQVTEPEPIS
jgi:DNA-binding NtrC family response regulator